MSNEIILKIHKRIDDLINHQENEEYERLGTIRKILTFNSERERLKELSRKNSKEFADQLINIKEMEYWEDILEKYEPNNLYETLNQIINDILAKKEPKNEWLEKKLIKIKLTEGLKDLTQENMEKLIRYAGLIYSMEETNKRIAGNINKEVRKLYPVIVNIPCFKNFNELVNGYSSILKHYVSLETLDKSLLQERFNRVFDEIKEKHKKSSELTLTQDYIKIRTYSIYEIVNEEVKKVLDTELFECIKAVQIDINNNVKQTLYSYLKLTSDKSNEAKKVIEHLNELIKKQTPMEAEHQLRYIHTFFQNVYGSISFDEYKKLFESTPIDEQKQEFLLINEVVDNYKYQEKLLNDLSNEQLDIFCEKTLKNDKLFSRGSKSLQEIVKNIKNTRIYDKEIEKFKSGKNTLDLQMFDTKLITVDLKKLSLLLRDKIKIDAQIYDSNDDYVLNIHKGNAKLFLIGEYANHLDNEECLEIFMEVINEQIGKKGDIVDNLIRSKRLKYQLMQEEVVEKNHIVKRKKV